jgi:hypothetical protein
MYIIIYNIYIYIYIYLHACILNIFLISEYKYALIIDLLDFNFYF